MEGWETSDWRQGVRMNGMRNCGRVDWETGNNWTVKKNKSNKKYVSQIFLLPQVAFGHVLSHK